MRSVVAALVLLLVAGGSNVVRGQVPARLTLEEAIRIAEANSAAFRAQQYALERSEINEQTSFRNTFLPRFSAGIRLNGGRRRASTVENFDGVPLLEPIVTDTRSSSSSQAVSVNMTLFSGQSWMQHRAARAAARGTAVRVEAQSSALRLTLSRMFFAVGQADQAVELERRLVERALNDLAVAEKRFELGLVEREAVSGAQLSLLRRQHALETAIGNARKARLDLLQAMGVEEEVSFETVGDVPEPFDPSALDVDELVRIALSSSPEIRQAEARLEEVTANVRATRASRWPTVTASASYGRESASRDYTSFTQLDPPNSSYSISLAVNVPVPYLSYSENASMAISQINLAEAHDIARQTRIEVENEVRRQLIDLQAAYREIQLQERLVEIQRGRVADQEEQARVGREINQLALETARDEEANAERALLNAHIAFQNRVQALEQLVGARIRP